MHDKEDDKMSAAQLLAMFKQHGFKAVMINVTKRQDLINVADIDSDDIPWATLPPIKYGPGDVVMDRETGQSGTVDAVYYDPEQQDLHVILTNCSGYKQSALQLLAGNL